MNYKYINKRGTYKAVLIHGLFATSGYWLNYLSHFQNCRLVILDLDYISSIDFNEYNERVEFLIDDLYGGKADFIFSHSLGTIVANGIKESRFKHSFEICPVHSSKRVSNDTFADIILDKSGHLYSDDLVNKKLADVDLALEKYKQGLKPSMKRRVYYPSDDIYFEYDHSTFYPYKIFKGDHFDIDMGLAAIFSEIDSYI